MNSFRFLSILFFLFPPQIKTNSLLYKCPDFYLNIAVPNKENEENSGNSKASGTQSLNIPPHLMSHFKQHEFRIAASKAPSCGIKYDVIKINLIDLDVLNQSTTFTTPTSSSDPSEKYNDIEKPFRFPTDNSTTDTTSTSSTSFLTTVPILQSEKNHFEDFNASLTSSSKTLETSATTEISFLVEDQDSPLCTRKLNKRKVHFTPSGFLFYLDEYYSPEEFCIQSWSNEEAEQWLAIRKCHINCANEKSLCIPLCCHLHEYMDLDAGCCQEPTGHVAKGMFQPVIYDSINRKVHFDRESYLETNDRSNTTTDRTVRPHYVSFKENELCPEGVNDLFFNEQGDSILDTKIHIKSNGKLAYIGDDRKWHYLENYCVAGIVNSEKFHHIDGMSDMTSVIYYCLDEKQPEHRENPWPSYMYIGSFSISSVFLFLTVIVYILLLDKQNIHGWTILSFVTSELFLFIFMTASYALGVLTDGDRTSKSTYCVLSAMFAHFFFLSTFTWLTIVNLDLWWTFKNFTPISERSKGKKRFCFYMSFAWGIPILILAIGLILQNIYSSHSSQVVVPDYGNRDCFISSHAKGFYLYYIIGTLLLVNFILISCTIITIYNFKKGARMATTSSSKTKERSFKLFAKLVVVMGVTWSLEFVLWVIYGNNFSFLFFIVDLCNIFQAVATFLIFVCKRKILNQLEQKHPALRVITKPLLKLVANRPGAHTTSSTTSKQTRSTTINSNPSSSVLQRGRRKSYKVSVADSNL